MNEHNHQFEQGPIRPPNEARSLLLRFTRNCPWNHCQFCPVYKKRKFSLRTTEEIKADIDAARHIFDDIKEISISMGAQGDVNDSVINHILQSPSLGDCYRSVGLWMYYRTGACFLQDADNLIMKTDQLIEVLDHLKNKFPDLTRITTYSRSKTVLKKSAEDLTAIRKAGLDRIHIGLETGHDPLLKMMKKGVTADEHIRAGKRVLGADMELSEYVMPGLGGKEMAVGHAIDTAKVLNAINPHFIRLRSLRVPKRVPLYEKLQDGTFTMQSDDEVAEEIKTFIETLDGITSTLTSDHMMNLLEEVSGKFPEDKPEMLQRVDEYLTLSDEDRWVFRAGRRGGAFRSVQDMTHDNATYQKIKLFIESVREKEGEAGVHRVIADMVDQYV